MTGSAPDLSDDEARRPKHVEQWEKLDSMATKLLDDAAVLAAALCGTAKATVSLVNAAHLRNAPSDGSRHPARSASDAACEHGTGANETPPPPFHARAPLATPEGHLIGSLCVFDSEPREITPAQLTALEALARTVSTHLARSRDIAELKRTIVEMDAHVVALETQQVELEAASTLYREQSLVDPVTRGPNRRAYELRIDEEHQRARRHGWPYALLVIDIDRFKEVNDGHGHAKGDDVLSMAFRLMRRAIRPSDFLGRLGGDEFVAILPHADHHGAQIIAERMRRAIYNASWGTSVPVTVSIGIGDWNGEKMSVSEVLERADEALYDSKVAGRNYVSGPQASLF